MRHIFLLYLFLFVMFSFCFTQNGLAQDSTKNKWGPKDTIIVSVIDYEGEAIPYKELENVYVSNLPPAKLAKAIAKYNRLRNAVYVTYPYAKTAGITIIDVARHLGSIKEKDARKKYLKTREKELKERFTDPLSNLSVYQGKVLMKLINRQAGNDCYELIKEYKGGVNARMYQTIAFFFGSNLKQEYDMVANANDRQIESIVREIDGVWYNNANKPAIRAN